MAKTKSQSFSRPPMERMMRFHDLLKEQTYPNCNQVAKEFEVSWRTIMRDVDFMKCRLKLPMEFDSRRNGYLYTKPVNQFPHLPLSQSEVFALLVAHSDQPPGEQNGRFCSHNRFRAGERYGWFCPWVWFLAGARFGRFWIGQAQMAPHRLAVDVQFTRNPPVGPAMRCQCRYGVL